jgi:PPOX class probable F420-dependent enzyme
VTTTLADEKYVVLNTRKKNGDTVATPVWIAALPDGALGFTTELSSGKVKRIRNFADVTLQPSNARGVPKPGTTPVAATASVLSGADADAVEQAIKAKYGFQVTLINIAYGIGRIVKRRPKEPGGAIRIELG